MTRKPLTYALLITLWLVCAATAQEVQQVSAEEAAQHVISRVEPKYPPMAEMAHIQGVVIIRVVIDEQGRVTERKAISGHPLLIEPSMVVVRDWRFAPFMKNGNPVKVSSLVRVDFALGADAEHRRYYLQQEAECTKQIFARNFAGGERVCRKALAIAGDLPKGFELEKMRAYGNAGTVTYELQKFPEALENFKQQLIFAQQALQPGNPHIVRVRGNVAHTYVALNQLPEAETEYTEIEKTMQAAEADVDARRDKMKAEAYEGARASYAHNMQIILQEHAALLRRMGKLSEAQALEQSANSPGESKQEHE